MMEKQNKIIMEGECYFVDKDLRKYVSKLETKIETINERTKRQTLQIKELDKKIKQLEKSK